MMQSRTRIGGAWAWKVPWCTKGAHGSIYLVNAQLALVARLSDCRLPHPLPGLSLLLGAFLGYEWHPWRFWEASVHVTWRRVMRMGVRKGSHGPAFGIPMV